MIRELVDWQINELKHEDMEGDIRNKKKAFKIINLY